MEEISSRLLLSLADINAFISLCETSRMHCVYCKGSHEHTSCPLFLRAMSAVAKVKPKAEYVAESPAPFIGHYGYPHVNVGMLTVPEKKNTRVYDDPTSWVRQKFAIPDVVGLRRSLVNARAISHITSSSRQVERVQDIALARRPVDVEVTLKKAPAPALTFNQAAAPFGPQGAVSKAILMSNPSTHTKVDKVVSDSDRPAASSMQYLSRAGFDEHYLSRILSVGVLGVKANRKLVPTRWSITATDDTLAKPLLEEIKTFSTTECQVCIGKYMGNYYFFIFSPLPFSYELFEVYVPGCKNDCLQYSTDYESHFGRKGYAKQCAGGYYSVRLALAQYFHKIRRQASVFVLRMITDEYTTPLGVWVTREAARQALSNKPVVFSTSTLAQEFVQNIVRKKFGVQIESLFKRSKLLGTPQSRLSQWT
ncbi:hypothetical protein GF342_03780 [Candidatus Woesearchaeota archaeon]|nr:hypothetical protein [Candidatus Woesearchaeota archaeon]